MSKHYNRLRVIGIILHSVIYRTYESSPDAVLPTPGPNDFPFDLITESTNFMKNLLVGSARGNHDVRSENANIFVLRNRIALKKLFGSFWRQQVSWGKWC